MKEEIIDAFCCVGTCMAFIVMEASFILAIAG